MRCPGLAFYIFQEDGNIDVFRSRVETCIKTVVTRKGSDASGQILEYMTGYCRLATVLETAVRIKVQVNIIIRHDGA